MVKLSERSIGHVRSLYAPPSANLGGVDTRLTEIISAAAQDFLLKVVVTPSGGALRGKRNSTSQHVLGRAIDIQIYDKNNQPLDNNQSIATFRIYEQFAQLVRQKQQELHPQLSSALRWGGYFSGKPTKENYGAVDLMHFDLGGLSGMRMGGGSWDTGLYPEQRKLMPGVVSIGMGGDRTAIPIPRPRPAVPGSAGDASPLAGPKDNRAPQGIGPRPDDLVPPVGEADRRAVAQRAQRTIAGSAGGSALTYPYSDSSPAADPRMRPFFSAPERFPEGRFESAPRQSPFLPSTTLKPLNYAPTPQRGRAHAAIDDLLAPPAPRPDAWPHASEATAAAADVDDEIAAIERRLRTDRRGYFRDEDMQERYRELLGIRARRRW